MSERLYDMMDWPEIEAVVYSEESEPKRILGPRKTPDGILIQCFRPGAQQVKVLLGRGKPEYEMEMEDEAGFFSVLLPGDKIPKYKYEAVYETHFQVVEGEMRNYNGLGGDTTDES